MSARRGVVGGLISSDFGVVLALLVLIFAGGWSGCVASPEISIDLVFDSDCQTTSCEELGLGCGARVLVQLLPTTPEGNSDAATGEPLFRDCIEVLDATDFCAVDRPDFFRFDALPIRDVELEFAVWSSEHVQSCPEGDLFDLGGELRDEITPRPALGGSRFIRPTSSRTVTVPLTCMRSPSALAGPTCTDGAMAVRVILRDMTTGLASTAAPESVAVSFAKAIAVGGTSSAFTLTESNEIPFVASRSAWFAPEAQIEFMAPVEDTGCVGVVTLGATPVFHCTSGLVEPAQGELAVEGWSMPRALLEKIASAAGISPSGAGSIIGRVVDEDILPVAGAVVASEDATIIYLGEVTGDAIAIVDGATSTSGYFVAFGARHGGRWQVTAPGRVLDDARASVFSLQDRLMVQPLVMRSE